MVDRIVVMDVGNSNIVIGVYEGTELACQWRLSTTSNRTVDEFGIVLKGLFHERGLPLSQLDGIVISSVVPPLMHTLEETCLRYFAKTPLVVGPGMKTGLSVVSENPREVGADRIVNAVAALHLYGPPVMVVDCGTATTVCVIDDQGRYLGGLIAPGLEIATEALYQRAAKLPRIELVRPKSVVGRNTVSSMQAGVIYGFVGLVDGLVERIREEIPLPFRVVATGGMADLIAADSRHIDVVHPTLTLEGLRVLWEKNR